MKPKTSVNFGNFCLDIGWFQGDPCSLFTLILLEHNNYGVNDGSYILTIFDIGILKFSISITYNNW